MRLLRDLRVIFAEEEELTTQAVLLDLFRVEDAPWSEWWADPRSEASAPTPSRGATMKLARMLKPLDIHPQQLWIDEKKVRGYKRETFKDAWNRYLPPDPPEKVAESVDPAIHAENGLSKSVGDNQPSTDLDARFLAQADGSTDLPTSQEGLGAKEAKTMFPPGLGDDGYLALLEAAYDAGHITGDEAVERLALHGLVAKVAA